MLTVMFFSLWLSHRVRVVFYFYKPHVCSIKLSVGKIFKCFHKRCSVPSPHDAAAELQVEPFPVFDQAEAERVRDDKPASLNESTDLTFGFPSLV